MKDNEMTDDQIIKNREEKYGPPLDCFNTWAKICTALDNYAKESPWENKAHLYALKMAALKMVRSVWNPSTLDNYPDGRNYFSIAQMCSRDAIAKGKGKHE
tara:strand:+ start:15411 stop:15713 length:303 start_codon:yes stop_codon:yes gene_type:complete